jgi:hypothetical protein
VNTPAGLPLSSGLLLLLACTAVAADPWSALGEIGSDSEPAVAKQRLEALLLEHPAFLPAHFNLGTLLMEGDREAAASHLETAATSGTPALAHDAWYNLALVRWKQGRLEDAIAAAGRAVALMPKREETIALRDELRRVALVRSDEARRKALEEAKKLRLTTTQLPDAHVGETYDQRLEARGGAGGYRFALGLPTPAATAATAPAPSVPPLPPGLSLEADGRLHGIPTAAGRHELALVVNDSAQGSVTGSATVVIQPAPAITTTTLPEAIVGAPYEATLESVGLADPRWTVEGLPPGLALSTARGPSARLSGIPTTAGTASLTVRADDGTRRAQRGGDTPGLPLVVSDTFAPDLAVLPPATAWAPYEHRLGVRGKAQAYRWRSAGAGGLAIAEDGRVSGKPDQAGELHLPATILAADGRSRDTGVTVPVNPPPVIDEPSPIRLTQGQAVTRPLKVTGGTPPYSWNVVQGVLPKGVRLDQDGTLRGAASEALETDVTVALADRWQARTQHQIHLAVTPPEDRKDEQKKDEQKKDDQNQEQQKQDQQQAEQDQPQNDQQNQDQQKQDQQNQDQGRQQAKRDQQERDRQQAGGQPDGEQQQPSAAERAAQQAQVLNQAAADRWLEALPKEDRDVLMYQLLEGGELKPRKGGKAW